MRLRIGSSRPQPKTEKGPAFVGDRGGARRLETKGDDALGAFEFSRDPTDDVGRSRSRAERDVRTDAGAPYLRRRVAFSRRRRRSRRDDGAGPCARTRRRGRNRSDRSALPPRNFLQSADFASRSCRGLRRARVPRSRSPRRRSRDRRSQIFSARRLAGGHLAGNTCASAGNPRQRTSFRPLVKPHRR